MRCENRERNLFLYPVVADRKIWAPENSCREIVSETKTQPENIEAFHWKRPSQKTENTLRCRIPALSTQGSRRREAPPRICQKNKKGNQKFNAHPCPQERKCPINSYLYQEFGTKTVMENIHISPFSIVSPITCFTSLFVT